MLLWHFTDKPRRLASLNHTSMKIIVIGLGSMGKRRIRLLKSHYPSFELYGVDSRDDRRRDAETDLDLETFGCMDAAIQKIGPDAAFACTSPLSHALIVTECLSKGIHTFSEINLVANGYELIIDLATKNNLRAFLSSTPLYRAEVEYIAEQVKLGTELISYSYHVGQYLPDWHPWEDYRDFFVGDKRTNGCRELMGIELPWIISTFGEVSRVHTVKRNITKLRIDYPDTLQISVEHCNGNIGQWFFNVVSREATRRLEIISEEIFISWSGTADSLLARNRATNTVEKIELYGETTHLAGYADNIIEEPYLEEIVDFVAGIENPDHQFRHSYIEDRNILDLIDRIEAA